MYCQQLVSSWFYIPFKFIVRLEKDAYKAGDNVISIIVILLFFFISEFFDVPFTIMQLGKQFLCLVLLSSVYIGRSLN